MNIYYEILSNLTANKELFEEYLEICSTYSNFKNKNDAETHLQCKVELHHILPKCFKLGGEKDKLNHTYLPLLVHRNAHKLLKDMFTGNKKKQMCFAYSRIIHRHNSKEEISEEEYLNLKTEISKMIGELNSKRIITEEYRNNMSKIKSNTFWVNNDFQEIMLQEFEEIPIGYKRGRISNKNKNRIWINDGETNKMVYPSEPIPIGWVRGIKKKGSL